MNEKAILLQLPGLIAWKDSNSHFLGCNAAFAKICRLPHPDAIIGLSNQTLFQPFFPKTVIKMLDNLDKNVIDNGKMILQEELFLNQTGQAKKYISQRLPLRDDNDCIIGMSINLISSESIYAYEREIIERSVGHVYWKDKESRYLGCNTTFAKYMGLEKPADLIGRTDEDFQPKHVSEQINKNDQTVILLNETIRLEEKALSPTGNVDYFLSEKKPLKNNLQENIGIIGNSIIITKQKKNQQVKNNIIMSLSHDLRTPFTGIRSVADLLLFNETDDTKKELIQHIITSSEVILENINTLINLAISDLDEEVSSDFDINKLIEKILVPLKSIAMLQKTAIKLDCPNTYINSDKHRLSKIIYNLISNAIKFTENGLVEIRITVTNKLEIIVKDTGIGIAPEHLHKIFELFFKANNYESTDIRKGSGIGLYLTKKFINDLEGEIEVESTLGKGTTFYVTIPFNKWHD